MNASDAQVPPDGVAPPLTRLSPRPTFLSGKYAFDDEQVLRPVLSSPVHVETNAGTPSSSSETRGGLFVDSRAGFAFTTQKEYDQLADEVLDFVTASVLDPTLQKVDVAPDVPIWLSEGLATCSNGVSTKNKLLICSNKVKDPTLQEAA